MGLKSVSLKKGPLKHQISIYFRFAKCLGRLLVENSSQRYLTARFSKANDDVYVQVYTYYQYDIKKPYVKLRVAETEVEAVVYRSKLLNHSATFKTGLNFLLAHYSDRMLHGVYFFNKHLKGLLPETMLPFNSL